MRRTGWTVAMACGAVVAIGGAQLAGTKDAEGERRACTVGTLRGSYVFSASGFNIVIRLLRSPSDSRTVSTAGGDGIDSGQ